MCVCICISICIFIDGHLYVCTYVYVNRHLSMPGCVPMCICFSVCLCMHAPVSVSIYISMCVLSFFACVVPVCMFSLLAEPLKMIKVN